MLELEKLMLTKKFENLIIVPVGSPVDKFCRNEEESKNHWRRTHHNRNYQILAVQYGDFVPEEGTYDDLIVMKGFKWTISKELYKKFDFTEWEYVGFYDDDVVLDFCTMDESFIVAKQNNFKAFQISLEAGSESQWKCTQNLEGTEYAYTNFIEIMCPVFNRSVLPKFMDLVNAYDVYCGWGLDYVLAEYLDADPAVIHSIKMYHPSRPQTGSTYDKSSAFKEMDTLLNDVYPRLMKEQNREIKVDYSNFKDESKWIVMKV
jgi:hypothetical protein